MHWYLVLLLGFCAQGNADAQHNLGVIHHKGQGVAQDIQKAAQWYQKAADQGHADAQQMLMQMHADMP